MTGLEGTALKAGGELLKAVAARAGKALAGKITFRWSVWWRVRGRVDFSCPWRTYRKWLKSVTAEELASPVEKIQAPLARRLDQALSAASTDWATADDHLSNSLRLVELTYPAIAAALGEADRVALTENWAEQRSVSVRDHLLQLVGPGAALSAYDLAATLHHRSRARRTVRLQAFGVDETTLAAYFDQIEAPDVPDGGVVILLGDFGSGKSETAEAWHRTTIENFVTCDGPFPVWLSARQLLGQTLEAAVDRQLAPTWRGGRGASIAVDGVDETDPAAAQALLDDARTLARTHANVRVFLTARPGILSPTATEETAARLLSKDEALQLVELAGGKSRSTWHWTAAMRETVTRPFFALAAGLMLGRDEAPRGEADLIRGLVEDALTKGTERSAVTSAETRSALQHLAVTLTRTGGDGLSFSDRQIARSSRLVADGPEGSVLFSLPIFQHWFAAQAILDHTVSAAEVVADAFSFNRWRWAAAVAALSATGAQAVDDLLAAFVIGNPGAAAWIIKEAFSGHRDWRTEDDEDLDAKTSGARLLRALRAWTDALGPLACGVLPHPLVQGPIGLGVTVSGHRINVAFSKSRPTADHVTEVPPGIHPIAGPAQDWLPWFSGAAPQGNAWPWTMTRKRIAEKTAEKLSSDPLLGAPDGIWAQERRFDLARRLLGRGSLFHKSLPAGEVRKRAEETFNAIGRDRSIRITLSGSTKYFGAELEDLIAWIDANATDQMLWHLPEEDISNPAGPPVWHSFSRPRLMEFEVEVYGRACEAYEEALVHSFASLGWSMPSWSFSPFGVLLEVRYDGDTRLGGISGLTSMRVPMALIGDIAGSGPEAIWSASGRAVIKRAEREYPADFDHYSATLETIRSWLAEQNREPIAGLGWTNGGADDMSNVRPASSVAAGWLWSDLQSIGLGSGVLPDLR